MTALRRFLLLASLCLAVIAAGTARAQEPAPPPEAPDQGTEAAPPAPGAAGNLFPGATPAPGQPTTRNRPRPSRLLGNKSKRNARATDLVSAEADADPLDVRIAFRRAKTQAMLEDPSLADDLRAAAFASTDKLKREWLRLYYTRLYARVEKIDASPGLTAHVALLKVIARQRYDPQRRMVAGEEDLVNGRRGRR
jgi:hypothetical protein